MQRFLGSALIPQPKLLGYPQTGIIFDRYPKREPVEVQDRKGKVEDGAYSFSNVALIEIRKPDPIPDKCRLRYATDHIRDRDLPDNSVRLFFRYEKTVIKPHFPPVFDRQYRFFHPLDAF